MNLEFLIGLGIDEETAAKILEMYDYDISEIEEKRISDKFSLAVNYALLYAGAINARAAAAILDFEFTGDDFEIEPLGLSDAIAKLKVEAPYLFCDKNAVENEIYTFVGITPAAASDTDIDAGELSYSEYMRLYRN